MLGIAIGDHGTINGKDVYLYFDSEGIGETLITNEINRYELDGTSLLNPSSVLELPATSGLNHPGGKLTLDK